MSKDKSIDYWLGYHAESARQVAKSLGRDGAAKRRILERNPGLLFGMDAREAEAMSGAEFATRELHALGITTRSSDPIELLDAHHAGREFARRGGRPAAMDGGGDTYLDRYLKEK